MHPKQICADFKSMGALLVLDGDELYIDNPENIYLELEEFAKSYKSRIVAYLKGNYSNEEHNIKQTIDKIISFYCGMEQDMNEKINNWLNHDEDAVKLVMELTVELSYNGWEKVSEPICNYENEVTDNLSKEIFDRAMFFFKKGVVKQ